MDETIKKLLLLGGALSLIFFQLGCKQTSSGQKIFPTSRSGCSKRVIPNEYLVQWKDGSITIEHGRSIEDFKREFVDRHLDDIQIVEEHQMIYLPNNIKEQLRVGSYFFNQSDIDWGVNNINAQSAWSRGVYGSYLNENNEEIPVVVAVIDDGIDLFHKKLKKQIYYNEGEIGLDQNGNEKSTNGIDDDNNGKIDDFAGYNFAEDSPYVRDSSSHGTHVSGIIVAQHGEISSTVRGVAPNAKILPLDFMHNGGGAVSDAIEAIDYAVMRGAKVINASWGGPQCSAALEDRINNLVHQNVLFVAAAGNESIDIDTQFVYPASFDAPSLLVVGSIQQDDLMARHSNYGAEHVDLFAPGKDIVSTVTDSLNSEKVAAMTGTSMATPFVSGAAALLISAFPNLPVETIKEALMSGTFKDEFYRNASKGKLNVGLALQALGR